MKGTGGSGCGSYLRARRSEGTGVRTLLCVKCGQGERGKDRGMPGPVEMVERGPDRKARGKQSCRKPKVEVRLGERRGYKSSPPPNKHYSGRCYARNG